MTKHKAISDRIIKTGIKAGIRDCKAGRIHEVNNTYVANLQKKLLQRLQSKQT